jgi:hypothetical protein
MIKTSLLGWLGVAAILLPMQALAEEAIAVRWYSSSGSVAPPYWYSTSIVIDGAGQGRYESLVGDDPEAPGQRYQAEFTVSAEARAAFAAEMARLGAFERLWRERQEVTVGGPLRQATLERGDQRVRIPAFPVEEDAEAARQILAAIWALVPDEVLERRRASAAGRKPE